MDNLNNQNFDTLGSLTEIRNMQSSSNIITIIIILVILYFVYNYYISTEHFRPGVFTQMQAIDEQDQYLTNNTGYLANGNYNMNWNQPSRIVNNGHIRGRDMPTTDNKKPLFIPDAYVADY